MIPGFPSLQYRGWVKCVLPVWYEPFDFIMEVQCLNARLTFDHDMVLTVFDVLAVIWLVASLNIDDEYDIYDMMISLIKGLNENWDARQIYTRNIKNRGMELFGILGYQIRTA